MRGRLAERDMRVMYLRPRSTNADNAYGEPIPAWGEPVTLRASVQPTGSAVAEQVYGQEVATMCSAYYAGIAEIRLDDGVCLNVAPVKPPDYLVAGIRAWPGHRRIDLKYVPEAKRGAGE